MTIKSAIAEVRDQLCLDTADGEKLNIVTNNLGFPRNVNGFSDDVWRAIIRLLSIQNKLTVTKIEAVLSVILGPKITEASALARDIVAGDLEIYILEPERFPQVGTVVLDEGQINEETLFYSFLDKDTGKMTLSTPALQAHTAVNVVWETPIMHTTAASDTIVSVFDSTRLVPNCTLLIGRGLAEEYVDILASVPNNHTIALTNTTLNILNGAKATGVTTSVTQDTQENTVELLLAAVEPLLPQSGLLQIDYLMEVPANGGTTTSVVSFVPLTSPLAGGDFAGCVLRFRGTATPALEGKLGFVASTAGTTFLLLNTLPAAPVVGDDFDILVPLQYNRVLPDASSILLKEPFPNLGVVLTGSKVTQLTAVTTVAIAQVQVKGTRWDVIQSDPRNIEVLLPIDALPNDIRSASYIRDTSVNLAASTTATAAAVFGSTTLKGTTSSFSDFGMLTVDGFQHVYRVPHNWTTQDAEAGALTLLVESTRTLPSSGTIDLYQDSTLITTTTYTVTDDTTLTVAALPVFVARGCKAKLTDTFILATPLNSTVSIADPIVFFSSYLDGNLWSVQDTWPGPYCWDSFENVKTKETVGNITSTLHIAGLSRLAIDAAAGRSVLELENANYLPTTVPFQFRVGENSGNVETVAVQQISLKSRCHTTLSAGIASGVTTLPVTSLSGPTGPLHTFPNAASYRVLIAPASGGPREVVEVIGTATGPNRLLLSSPTTMSHGSGVRVLLLADLLRVAPVLIDDHLGICPESDKFAFYARETQANSADTCRPVYSTIVLTDGTDFPTAGTACFNFGSASGSVVNKLSVVAFAGDTVLYFVDTSNFPTSYPYLVTVSPGAGPLFEQTYVVTNNDTIANELTIASGLLWGCALDIPVVFNPGPEEKFSYTNKTGATLTVPSSPLVTFNHQKIDNIAPMEDIGYPDRFGFEFPTRIPVSLEERIRYVLDLIRAAGVRVSFITQR